MEIFVLFRQHLATSGIEISGKPSKYYPFNAINSIIFILICINASVTALTLIEASSFEECTDILFRSVSLCVCGAIYEIIVCNATKLLEFINSLGDFIEESE